MLSGIVIFRARHRQTGMQQTSAISDANEVGQERLLGQLHSVVIDYSSSRIITGR